MIVDISVSIFSNFFWREKRVWLAFPVYGVGICRDNGSPDILARPLGVEALQWEV
jgi:hypothetical protein